MRLRLVLWTALLVVVAEGMASAEAPALVNGRAHYLGARFEEAERAFESVLENGDATRADLAEAFRYLAVLRLVRGARQDAAEAAVEAVSLDRGVTPPEGAPPTAEGVFDQARGRVPSGGLSCRLELPDAPVASSPVGARVHVVGDPGGLVATASVSCAGRERRGTPERQGGEVVAEIAVDGGPAGRRTECVARVLTAANVVLAEASGTFVARGAGAGGADDAVHDTAAVGRVGTGAAGGRRGDDRRRVSGFPWVWVGVGAGVVVAGAVVAAVLIGSASDEAYLRAPSVVGE